VVLIARPRGLSARVEDETAPGSWPHATPYDRDDVLDADYEAALPRERHLTARELRSFARITAAKFVWVRRAGWWLLATLGVLVVALLIGIVRLVALLVGG
jgi:hypothetical protein